MKIEGISHLNLRVKDPEISSRFYGGVLGLREFARDSFRKIYLYAGADIVTLERTKDDIPKDGFHLGFLMRSADDMSAWKSRLAEAGVAITKEQNDENGWSIYFRDPDQYLIEIFYIRD